MGWAARTNKRKATVAMLEELYTVARMKGALGLPFLEMTPVMEPRPMDLAYFSAPAVEMDIERAHALIVGLSDG